MASLLFPLLLAAILVSMAIGALIQYAIGRRHAARAISRQANLKRQLRNLRNEVNDLAIRNERLSFNIEDLLTRKMDAAAPVGMARALGIPRLAIVPPPSREGWRQNTYEFMVKPAYASCGTVEQAMLDIMRSPSNVAEAALAIGIERSDAEDLVAALVSQGRMSDMGGRYVTTHEGHAHGLMNVVEATVYRNILRSRGKRLVIDEAWQPKDGTMDEIRKALAGLSGRGYLHRVASGVYDLVPIPVP